jgi:hypothetical protein
MRLNIFLMLFLLLFNMFSEFNHYYVKKITHMWSVRRSSSQQQKSNKSHEKKLKSCSSLTKMFIIIIPFSLSHIYKSLIMRWALLNLRVTRNSITRSRKESSRLSHHPFKLLGRSFTLMSCVFVWSHGMI